MHDSSLIVTRLEKISRYLMGFAVLLIYLAPFWWPFNDSGWVSLVRIAAFSSMLCVAWVAFLSPPVIRLHSGRLLFYSLILLFTYLCLNAYFLGADAKVFRRLAFLSVFVFALGTLKWDDRRIRQLAIILAITGFTFALLSLLIKYMQNGLPTGYRKRGIYESGLTGVADFGNTIVAAMHFAISIVMLTYLFLTEHKKMFWPLWLGMLATVAAYLMLTFARTGWVACTVAGAVLFLLTWSRKSIPHYTLLVIFTAAVGYFFANFFQYEFHQRGLTYRDEIWLTVLERSKETWWFGKGVMASFDSISIGGGRQLVNNSHSVYLEILYQTGLIGLIFYFLVIVFAVITLFKARKLKEYSQGVKLAFSMLLAVSVVMVTELNSWIHTPNLLWQWLWIPLAYVLGISSRASAAGSDKVVKAGQISGS